MRAARLSVGLSLGMLWLVLGAPCSVRRTVTTPPR